MKKFIMGIGILFLIVLAIPALAANGAVVITDPGCSWMQNVFPKSQAVLTPGGEWKFTGIGTIPEGMNLPKKAENYSLPCDSRWGIGEAKITMTPSGLVLISCHGES